MKKNVKKKLLKTIKKEIKQFNEKRTQDWQDREHILKMITMLTKSLETLKGQK